MPVDGRRHALPSARGLAVDRLQLRSGVAANDCCLQSVFRCLELLHTLASQSKSDFAAPARGWRDDFLENAADDVAELLGRPHWPVVDTDYLISAVKSDLAHLVAAFDDDWIVPVHDQPALVCTPKTQRHPPERCA